ncbi:Uma2 family endonuclease [Romeria aff. gracilis LEGE 07310]|uniref:Uma2 family endonuclease n=1 Tax=Vasconcelosia minhoensis LEGE 07310 TaxID=915328 RepID=A0A8J7DQZ2_9CYAN|nr:Uma2 family endonuclease [Romeria gracilis]MBE9077404.1 Uma2 family endonuclease [Romeria aff. gracilis LEGE 07310]
MTSAADLNLDVDYPESDGKPMAESDYQRPYIAYGTEILNIFFADQPQVYVSGNLLIYYEEGNPKACVAPDVFVVLNRPKGKRKSYRTWQENNQYPSFILEITSKSTISEDQGTKRGLYAFWGVPEYFQYDPSADYLEPPLQGHRLVEGNYLPIPATPLPQGGLSITSSVLGLELRLEQGELRFYNPATGKKLLSHAESEAARQTAEAARQVAQDRAEQLAARLRSLGIDPDSV